MLQVPEAGLGISLAGTNDRLRLVISVLFLQLYHENIALTKFYEISVLPEAYLDMNLANFSK